MEASKLVPLPPIGLRFVQYALAYTVTLGVGLAPILGRQYIPLFSPIAEVFPVNLQNGLVPFATFMMALPVIAAHFFSRDRVPRKRLNLLFLIVSPFVLCLPLLLYFFYSLYVIQVDFEGGRGSAAYVIGTQMRPACPCAKVEVDIGTCIGNIISANPAEVTACYDRAETNPRRATLAIIYLLLMLSFAALVALLVLKIKREDEAEPPSGQEPAR